MDVPYESLVPAIRELERFGNWFLNRRCDIPDQPVTVTVQTRGKQAALCGKFTPERWSTREGSPVHEINVCAEWLKADVPDILETMAHETVHYWTHFLQIKDYAKSGRHNKNFKEYAEIAGLTVEEPRDRLGFAYTSLTDDLRTEIEQDFKPDHTAFALFRTVPAPVPTASKTKAYICQCADGPTVRTGKEFNATCDDCNTQFIPKE